MVSSPQSPHEHAIEGEANTPSVALLCVGNMLMLDDGIGHAVYEELTANYVIPDNVLLLDAGCMAHEHLALVRDYDVVISIDAVDGTGEEPGTVFEFTPDDMRRNDFGTASLHDLKLADLFDAAALLGYSAEGKCFGMQVLNSEPSEYIVGLTEPCAKNLPLLCDCVVAELARRGIVLERRVLYNAASCRNGELGRA